MPPPSAQRSLLGILLIFPVGALFFFTARFFSSAPNRDLANEANFLVNLHSGIPDIIRLGDTEAQLAERSKKYQRTKQEVKASPETAKIDFSHLYIYSEIGLRAYFRKNRVALIELQEPFRGTIHGRKLQLFSFAPPPGQSWEELLIREFGMPQARASGGKLGSEAMFYFWGDISFNRMGPNQLALYHDGDISSFRQTNFGRDMKFF